VNTRLTGPFLPLADVFGDDELAGLLSETALVESWLEVERGLATVQASLGLIPPEAAESIQLEANATKVDLELLHESTRRVGYPILPLLEQISARSSDQVSAYIHWGATTQDIMDTGLALQIRRVLERIDELVAALGASLADLAERNCDVMMAGRTHAQQAVPTTFGAKVAVWLVELQRHVARLQSARSRVQVVQLFGAAGTAAALGPSSKEVRHRLAEHLGLEATDVPWHSARDGLAELGFVLCALTSTCGKIAREIIELSRSEIGEVREGNGHDRGASSTMPQKANPIRSEVAFAMSVLARPYAAALLAAMQTGHERSAGEWQVEWDSLPTLFALAGGCLANTREIIETLEVFPARMRQNMEADGGMIMAEAVMIAIAPTVGRRRAHNLVAEACREARRRNLPLANVLPKALGQDLLAILPPLEDLLAPESYLGEAGEIVTSALEQWARSGANVGETTWSA
jgi:3-carboxy-cis,cis-muconate cycloisomerase